jgi:hypothetical protein
MRSLRATITLHSYRSAEGAQGTWYGKGGVACELSLCWRVAKAVEVVETNWISFLLIALFIFLLFVFTLLAVCVEGLHLNVAAEV